MEEPSSLEDVEKLLDEMLGADGSSLGVYQGCLPTLERVEMKLGLLVDRKFQSLLDPFSSLVLSINMPIIKEKNVLKFMKFLLNESAAQAGPKMGQKKGAQKSRKSAQEEKMKAGQDEAVVLEEEKEEDLDKSDDKLRGELRIVERCPGLVYQSWKDLHHDMYFYVLGAMTDQQRSQAKATLRGGGCVVYFLGYTHPYKFFNSTKEGVRFSGDKDSYEQVLQFLEEGMNVKGGKGETGRKKAFKAAIDFFKYYVHRVEEFVEQKPAADDRKAKRAVKREPEPGPKPVPEPTRRGKRRRGGSGADEEIPMGIEQPPALPGLDVLPEQKRDAKARKKVCKVNEPPVAPVQEDSEVLQRRKEEEERQRVVEEERRQKQATEDKARAEEEEKKREEEEEMRRKKEAKKRRREEREKADKSVPGLLKRLRRKSSEFELTCQSDAVWTLKTHMANADGFLGKLLTGGSDATDARSVLQTSLHTLIRKLDSHHKQEQNHEVVASIKQLTEIIGELKQAIGNFDCSLDPALPQLHRTNTSYLPGESSMLEEFSGIDKGGGKKDGGQDTALDKEGESMQEAKGAAADEEMKSSDEAKEKAVDTVDQEQLGKLEPVSQAEEAQALSMIEIDAHGEEEGANTIDTQQQLKVGEKDEIGEQAKETDGSGGVTDELALPENTKEFGVVPNDGKLVTEDTLLKRGEGEVSPRSTASAGNGQ